MTRAEELFEPQYGWYRGPPFPDHCIEDCSHSGDCLPDVLFWQMELDFHVPRDRAIRWLREFGAWDDEELAAKSDIDLAHTVLWLACADMHESRKQVRPWNQGLEDEINTEEYDQWLGLVH